MNNSRPIRVLSIDDHPLLSEGISTLINSQSDMELVGSAFTGADGIAKFRELRPDIALMDLRLPDLSGIEVLKAIRAEFPEARIVLLTMFAGDFEIQRALRGGAQGYLLKSMQPEQIVEAIRHVCAGRKRVPEEIAAHLVEHLGEEPLTEREIEVIRQVSGGNRNRDIAKLLFVCEETVKVHMKHIMEKLGARDRTQAMAIAARRGFIHL